MSNDDRGLYIEVQRAGVVDARVQPIK